MIAEIKGKVNRQNTNLTELGEDELTGNFFGSMRYIPFHKGMKKILKKSIRPTELQAMIDEIDEYDWDKNIFFWEKVKDGESSVELDVRLDFPAIIIGIEVKYRSGLSSDDDADDEEISAETSVNQLSKEARVLRLLGQGKKKLLLLLADDLACAKTVQDARARIIDSVQLGYLSWQEVLLRLKELTGLNEFERLVISDLAQLLERKGFARFSGFKFTMPEVADTAHWHFELPRYNITFSFDMDKTVEDRYYEFG